MRTTVAAALVALVAAVASVAPTSASARANDVQLTAAFAPGARLGTETPLRLGLSIDPRRVESPVREVRLTFPASLGILTSGLGTATCRRPASDFAKVIIDAVNELAGCSRNAVMGRGTARAEIRLGGHDRASSQVIPEEANVTMLAAPFTSNRPGLLFLANGLRPFGVTLGYSGRIDPAPAPFGGTLTMTVAPVPNLYDATVALTSISFVIGAPSIRYRTGHGPRATLYRPVGITLPDRCPRAGFPFRATLALADGSQVRARAAVACPRVPRR
jgi:hypothetical protein